MDVAAIIRTPYGHRGAAGNRSYYQASMLTGSGSVDSNRLYIEESQGDQRVVLITWGARGASRPAFQVIEYVRGRVVRQEMWGDPDVARERASLLRVEYDHGQ